MREIMDFFGLDRLPLWSRWLSIIILIVLEWPLWEWVEFEFASSDVLAMFVFCSISMWLGYAVAVKLFFWILALAKKKSYIK
jgi:hypothetical protein